LCFSNEQKEGKKAIHSFCCFQNNDAYHRFLSIQTPRYNTKHTTQQAARYEKPATPPPPSSPPQPRPPQPQQPPQQQAAQATAAAAAAAAAAVAIGESRDPLGEARGAAKRWRAFVAAVGVRVVCVLFVCDLLFRFFGCLCLCGCLCGCVVGNHHNHHESTPLIITHNCNKKQTNIQRKKEQPSQIVFLLKTQQPSPTRPYVYIKKTPTKPT
jgi:hypothetical protein